MEMFVSFWRDRFGSKRRIERGLWWAVAFYRVYSLQGSCKCPEDPQSNVEKFFSSQIQRDRSFWLVSHGSSGLNLVNFHPVLWGFSSSRRYVAGTLQTPSLRVSHLNFTWNHSVITKVNFSTSCEATGLLSPSTTFCSARTNFSAEALGVLRLPGGMELWMVHKKNKDLPKWFLGIVSASDSWIL